MKKIYFILIWLFLDGVALSAQNLVPNPSFENYKNLPCSWTIEPSELSDYVSDWYVPTATSTDIHSTLADSSCWSNPLGNNSGDGCRIGYQEPHSGNAMAGIYTIVNTHTWHEYLQVKLKKPLVPGQRYCVQMWVSAADFTSHGSNNIGMLFTKEPVKGEDIILAYPQVNYAEVITDTKGWTLVSGSFIADSSDEYLTIGNFFPDSQTDELEINPNSCSNGAYYYIDDVAVFICPV